MSNIALALALAGLVLLVIAVLIWISIELDAWRARRRRARTEWHPPRQGCLARLLHWWDAMKLRRHRARLRGQRVIVEPKDSNSSIEPKPDPRSSIEQFNRIINRRYS